jgi:hypothetical protein
MDTLIAAVRWLVTIAGVMAVLAALLIGTLSWFLNHPKD